MNGDTQQAEFHNVSVQEPSENIYHGELLVSKETLPPSRHDDDNMHDLMIASRETFQQKIQSARPHKLEIKTKSRIQNKISIVTPPSNDNTPNRSQEENNYNHR